RPATTVLSASASPYISSTNIRLASAPDNHMAFPCDLHHQFHRAPKMSPSLDPLHPDQNKSKPRLATGRTHRKSPLPAVSRPRRDNKTPASAPASHIKTIRTPPDPPPLLPFHATPIGTSDTAHTFHP